MSAQTIHRRTVDQFDGCAYFVRFKPYQLQQTHLRDGITFAAAGDNQGRDNCQSQRNLHPYRSALAASRVNVHIAANSLDIRFYNVHPHATAGNIGDLLGGRKAWQEDEVANLALGHSRGLLSSDYAALDRLLANSLRIQSSAIVADFNVDLTALMKSPKDEASRSSFPCLDTLCGKFNPMVDGVPHQMGERIFDRLNDGFVQFGLLAFHFDSDLFVAA